MVAFSRKGARGAKIYFNAETQRRRENEKQKIPSPRLGVSAVEVNSL
jgi:hypothetical protein